MYDLLVGSTGFVGNNLSDKHTFEGLCHSTNVSEYYGSRPEICVYSGVPAAMYLANKDPEADLDIMRAARENLRRIAPQRVVLVSTIAVYDDSRLKNEYSQIDAQMASAYGRNRLTLENWVREDFDNSLIVRLPALYGRGIKKNFLFDLHTVTPALLTDSKYAELSAISKIVKDSYVSAGNGFYRLADGYDRSGLYDYFLNNDFNALSFTDSRSKYQFYNLSRLYGDITLALENGLDMLNIATPPISAREVYSAVTGKDDFKNKLNKEPFDYDMRTAHSGLFGQESGYILTLEDELADICDFMRRWTE